MIKKIVGFGLIGTALVGGGIGGGFYIGENVSIQQVEKAKDDYIKQGYEQGFQEALENKILLEKTIAEYKGKWETTKTELDGAKNQINILKDSNKGYVSQIKTLTADKQTWQDKATALETANTTLQAEKSDLQTSMVADKAEIERLKATGTADKAEIERLENVVSQKETLIAKYEVTIQANLDSMANINDKLIKMGNKIAEMSNQVLLNSQTAAALNATIAKLKKTIAYYEQFIAQMENGEKVVATFKFDGSVVNMQVVEKGSSVTATTPTSTEHVIFNYWMLNGEEVDPSTVTINSNTMFVANVTYKYDVNFIADGAQIGETQLVVKDGKANLPTAPTKEGYTFEGWTLNGTDVVDVENMQITVNTTFVAKFSQLHTVIFVSENETISTQSIKAGQCAENVSLESTTHKVFNGWKLNGVIVNVEETPINGAVTFVADYTYKYDVKFMVDDTQYGETQVVAQNGKPTLPTIPTKEGYEFDGWILNGNLVDPTTKAITTDTTFVAKFTQLHAVTFVSEDKTLSTQSIRNGNFAENVSVASTTHKVFNGWKVNNQIVDVETYSITAPTTFTADYTYKYDVKFMVDGAQYGATQIVEKNSKSTLPTAPTKDGYNFIGWTLNGTDVVSPATIAITANTTFTAKFEVAATWQSVYSASKDVSNLLINSANGSINLGTLIDYGANKDYNIRVTISYSVADFYGLTSAGTMIVENGQKKSEPGEGLFSATLNNGVLSFKDCSADGLQVYELKITKIEVYK